jgi:hypothetical protein
MQQHAGGAIFRWERRKNHPPDAVIHVVRPAGSARSRISGAVQKTSGMILKG